ncbi:SDR family NAD(P)-dependent oxidoreductase [Chiayiivirga flava]|uniref:NADP-dependent 3-hydroxy acid dehydrogenase YdfG n=1 Tax=Chiayiivirga flava TaxID=659595 RepID=A0A7W8G0B0_9GAMM|nr:SDR family NAD(P)-dependent oxidoreductase [Chiayiivirga flava]MBB5208089.1 NADP-dependent 3-hydroxy acid dehydrogenase YdfG [Chiayiivirga flava]
MFQRVLITGAGSGLGRALAQRYAAAGAAVGCADLHLDRAQETVAALPGSGHVAWQVDVGDDASFAAFAEAARAWGTPDLLVNNAGIAAGGTLLDSTMGEWRELLEVNLLSVVRGCKTFLPAMLDTGRGHVVNVASFAGLAGAPGIMSYGVAKGGVVILSEQLRAELHGSGVAVSVACPAFFQTNLLQNWRGSDQMRAAAGRLMQHSADTVDSVADAIVKAIGRGEFLILPTRDEPMRWRMKRWLPGVYFRQLLAMIEKRKRVARRAG